MTRIVKYLFSLVFLLLAGAQNLCAQQVAVKPTACHFWQEYPTWDVNW